MVVLIECDWGGGSGRSKQVSQQAPVVQLFEVAVAEHQRVGEHHYPTGSEGVGVAEGRATAAAQDRHLSERRIEGDRERAPRHLVHAGQHRVAVGGAARREAVDSDHAQRLIELRVAELRSKDKDAARAHPCCGLVGLQSCVWAGGREHEHEAVGRWWSEGSLDLDGRVTHGLREKNSR